jgi:hypothetical protein
MKLLHCSIWLSAFWYSFRLAHQLETKYSTHAMMSPHAAGTSFETALALAEEDGSLGTRNHIQNENKTEIEASNLSIQLAAPQ